MTTQSITATPSTHPYTERFDLALPRDLHRESAHMGWRDFLNTYSPKNGPLRLHNWSSQAIGGGLHRVDAIFHRRSRRSQADADAHHASATAAGEIRAASEMLHQLGYPLEIERFHQHSHGPTYATVIRATDAQGRSAWAIGFGPDGPRSATQAMLAAIARLY